MELNVTVESSGSVPAPGRRKFPGLRQALVGKRERTEAEAKAEVLHHLAKYRTYWYKILRKNLPERYVDDAYGQLCVKVTERMEAMDARAITNIKAYIARVCANVATDQLRRNATEAGALVKFAALSPEDRVDDPDNLIASERQIVLLGFLIEVLTERQSTAYALRHLMELKGPEIAVALDISYSLVRKELGAAQEAVDRALDDPEVNKRLRGLLDGL
ncbi:sigma-70 family RNA polymerase sigma factor [Streptomyces sp. NPDC002677]|uniref:RNA polymerase sigma factor n=1 Tax=Streptomyces sp. NPDC002677 TaxID=3154774 RepID=UPI00332D6985